MPEKKPTLLTRAFERLRKEAPKEIGSEAAKTLLQSIWVFVGGPTLLALIIGRWSDSAPDVKFALAIVVGTCGAIVWHLFFRTQGAGRVPTNKSDPEPAVEFWLPSKWEPGFRFKNLGLDERKHEVLAEEIHVRVLAKRRMNDVRFEMTARERQGNQLETLGSVGSDRFSGVVTAGLDQTFLVMRRKFSMVSATYPVLDKDNNVSALKVRVEREVIFFPENDGARFSGQMGHTYHFRIAVHHDDGPPDVASFNVVLTEKRVPVFSTIGGRENIQVIMG